MDEFNVASLGGQKDWRVRAREVTDCFVDDRCIRRWDMKVTTTELHKDYVEWCKQNQEIPESRQSLFLRLKEVCPEIRTKKIHGNNMVLLTIGLKDK